MRLQDDPVRIRYLLAVHEDVNLAGSALAGKTHLRQAYAPYAEELREREAAHGRRLDVDDTARVVGVEWRDELFRDAYPGGDDDAPAVGEDVEVLMDVEGRPRAGQRRKPERLEPCAQML